MANVTYHLSHKAQEELDAHKAMLISSCKSGLISKEQAATEFNIMAARLYAVARVESNGEEMVTVYCECKREHRIKADVHVFRCVCDFNVTRVTAEYRDKGGLVTRNMAREADAQAIKHGYQGVL